MLVCVSPPPCSLTCDADVKFVPVRVTLTDVPSAPLEGVIEISVGRVLAAVTVNGVVPLVPAVVVTEMLCCPVPADAAIANVAVACVLRFASEAHPALFDFASWPALATHASRCEALPPFQAITQLFIPPA